MTTAGLRNLERDLGRLFQEGSLSGASDARLLEQFVADKDAASFEALVARHRNMLLRTCNDLLGDVAEVEEAFQATVVILMRRAGSIREKDAIGGWLHRVACRVARRTRVQGARRRASEGRAVAARAQASGPPSDGDPLVRDELRRALHEEIDRLPERYRKPVILCLLEGQSQEDAAARLGWTAGSVRGRLARGKARLRDRLTRRGIAVTAVLAALGEPALAAAARPLMAVWWIKGAAAAIVALLALAGSTLTTAVPTDDPPKPIVKAVPSPQPAPPPKPEPQSEGLASFRGGGPTNASRATALPPEVAARSVDFRGRVVDPSGKGVAGARLSLVTDAWSVPEPQTVSGGDGSFHFAKAVGDFWRNFAIGGVARPHVQAVVLATHHSFGTAWVDLRVVAKDGKPALGGEYPLTLRMVADRPIVGRLVDEKGRPIAGATVRVEQLYAVPKGDLSPIIDALGKLDLKPYQQTHPRIWPNNLAAALAIPVATTGADGRFTLYGVGRDRQANLAAAGPAMTSQSWTVLNRDEATEVTEAIRARWPRRPIPAGSPPGKAVLSGEPAVQVYGPTFDLRVDSARTIAGVVRDATSGRPVPGAMVYRPNGAGDKTDSEGHYRVICDIPGDRFQLNVWPPEGARLLPAARELVNLPASGEVTADFALANGVVISGKALERGTGRPMLATQDYGCHGPGPVMAGRVWYRPLVGNASMTGTEAGAYFRDALTDPRGQFVALVERDGVFRGVVPPGLGVLLLEASPGMPFMWETLGRLKESEGYHRRFPYAVLTRREPADGAPGQAVDSLPGMFGPITLEGLVAYRVINPAANVAPYTVDITIPKPLARRVRFVDSAGRPARGAVVTGLTALPEMEVTLDDDEAEILALDRTHDRQITAVSSDGRLWGVTTVRADSVEPITVRMMPR